MSIQPDSPHGATRLNDDPEIVIRLPISAWHIVVQHLQAGAYRDVASVLSEISEQAEPQIREAQAVALSNGKPEESAATANVVRPH
jgi:hypothetical protein